MTKQVTRLASSVASRRGFLGNVGRGATALAAGLGGLLAFPTDARAKKGGGKKPKPAVWVCTYKCESLVYDEYTVALDATLYSQCPPYWGEPCWGPLIHQKKGKMR